MITLSLAVSFVLAASLVEVVANGRKASGRKANDPAANDQDERRSVQVANSRVASRPGGKKPPGGAWSEYNPEGKQGKEQSGNERNESGAEGAAAGAAHSNRNSPQASGAEARQRARHIPIAIRLKHRVPKGQLLGLHMLTVIQPQASGAEGRPPELLPLTATILNIRVPKALRRELPLPIATILNTPVRKVLQREPLLPIATILNIPAHKALPLELPRQPQQSPILGRSRRRGRRCRRQQQRSSILGCRRRRSRICRGEKQRRPSRHVQPTVVRRTSRRLGSRRLGRGRGVESQPNWGTRSPTIANYDIDTTPVSYNYGSNVTCIGNNVVVNGQPVGTAEEFSQQADELAEKGTAAAASPNDQWLPLGVFALVRNEHQHPQLIMQLAVNQQGILAGQLHRRSDRQHAARPWRSRPEDATSRMDDRQQQIFRHGSGRE